MSEMQGLRGQTQYSRESRFDVDGLGCWGEVSKVGPLWQFKCGLRDAWRMLLLSRICEPSSRVSGERDTLPFPQARSQGRQQLPHSTDGYNL